MGRGGRAARRGSDRARRRRSWEKEFHTKEGRRLPVIISGAVLDETRESGVAVVLDNTERKRVEDWLRLQSEALPVIVWTAAPGGNLDHLGGRAAEFLGISVDTLLGSGRQIIIHPPTTSR